MREEGRVTKNSEGSRKRGTKNSEGSRKRGTKNSGGVQRERPKRIVEGAGKGDQE